MLHVPLPREMPIAMGVVVGALAFSFGRWRRDHRSSVAGAAAWVGVIMAAVLGGIDLWNWLPYWSHRAVLDPRFFPTVLGFVPPLHYLNSPGNILFQGFLTPSYVMVNGKVVIDWYTSIWWWLPQAYLAVSITAGFSVLYMLGARQYRRLQYAYPWALLVAVGLGVLRLLGDLHWNVVHPAEWIFRSEIVQFCTLVAVLPILALLSRRLAWQDTGPGSGVRQDRPYNENVA